MMNNQVTVENAPRTLDGIAALPKTVRYRLALTLQMFGAGSNPPQEEGFLSLTTEQQSAEVFAALQRYDGKAGALPPSVVAPQQIQQPPQQMMQQPAPMQMQPVQVQAPMQAPARTPSTASDPNNAGSLQAPAPMAAPVAMGPQNGVSSGNGAGTLATQVPALLASLNGIEGKLAALDLGIKSIGSKIDEEVPGFNSIEEITKAADQIRQEVAEVRGKVEAAVIIEMSNTALLSALAESTLGFSVSQQHTLIRNALKEGLVNQLTGIPVQGKG